MTLQKPSAAWRTTLAVIAIGLFAALDFRGAGAQHRAQLSLDLAAHEGRHTTARARVIVHGTAAEVAALAARHQLQIVRSLVNGAVVFADSRQVTELAADAGVGQLSGDVPVRPWMSISDVSTAAKQTRTGQPGLLGLGGIAPVNGAGIGVAIIDSGVSPHAALADKVVGNVSLVTGDPSVLDAFGHGTHVAGIIAGSGAAASGVTKLYTGGIAPGAQIINVRVLGANGVGLTSDVIAGIDWAIAHKGQYNIRVINLSVGHPVMEPAAFDPLCLAVQRAAAAGIVVVAAAGNYGVAPDGSPILGGITSPGNSQFAITVGALNTFGTTNRSDDRVATYSSRGPTPYDFAVKPDIAAPGNKIISLDAHGSSLSTTYPFLHKAGSGNNEYMQLSGTSMSAPMVSGAVALFLQGKPGLSAAQIKLALQTGATYMPDGGLMGAGAGSVNFWATRRVTANGLLALTNSLLGGLLAPSSGATFWDDGSMTRRLYGAGGIRLLGLIDIPLVWADPSLLKVGNLNLVGLLNPLGSMARSPLLWGQVASWTTEQQIMWGTTIYNPEGQQIMWGTSDQTDGTQIMWGTSMTAPDPQ
jgi:serine protease AprX